MQPYQHSFIEFALARGALRFGTFTLKSGRISPYFFNTGLFNSGRSIALLGAYYAQAILAAGIEFDMLYGPAYKGIPLGTAVAIALTNHHGRDVPVCFNRKETKDHGEGGATFGAPLAGRVVIVDDVISAGTAVNEAVAIIRSGGATPVGLLIALDRQERGSTQQSAVAEAEQRHGLRVHSIIKLDGLVTYLRDCGGRQAEIDAIERYRAMYGT